MRHNKLLWEWLKPTLLMFIKLIVEYAYNFKIIKVNNFCI